MVDPIAPSIHADANVRRAKNLNLKDRRRTPLVDIGQKNTLVAMETIAKTKHLLNGKASVEQAMSSLCCLNN